MSTWPWGKRQETVPMVRPGFWDKGACSEALFIDLSNSFGTEDTVGSIQMAPEKEGQVWLLFNCRPWKVFRKQHNTICTTSSESWGLFRWKLDVIITDVIFLTLNKAGKAKLYRFQAYPPVKNNKTEIQISTIKQRGMHLNKVYFASSLSLKYYKLSQYLWLRFMLVHFLHQHTGTFYNIQRKTSNACLFTAIRDRKCKWSMDCISIALFYS